MANVHDALFKKVFSHPEQSAGFLRQLLPARVLDALDLSQLRAAKGSFVDPKLRQRQADLLLRCPRKDGKGEAFIYLLLEHQSSQDALMPFRLLAYVVRIWEAWLREHPGATRLPAILPIVLHHGERQWSTARQLSDVVELTGGLEALQAWLPQFHFLLHDLAALSDEDLEGHALLRLTLLLFKHGREKRLMELASTWIPLLQRVVLDAQFSDALESVVAYLVGVQPEFDQQKLEALMSLIQVSPPLPYRTIADALRDEGRALGHRAGLEQGRAQGVELGRAQGVEAGVKLGREQGRVEGQRVLAVRLLEARFGALSSAQKERVALADAAQLERWLLRAVEADSLAELTGLEG